MHCIYTFLNAHTLSYIYSSYIYSSYIYSSIISKSLLVFFLSIKIEP